MIALIFWWAQAILGPLSMILMVQIGVGARCKMLHEWEETCDPTA